MPAATIARAPQPQKVLAQRQKLCEELVGIHNKNASVFDRVEAIKTELKQLATDAGENFQIVIAGKGKVSVAGAKDGAYKGDLPILHAEAWLALKPAARQKHIDSGLIKVEAQFGGKYYGAVTVTLF